MELSVTSWVNTCIYVSTALQEQFRTILGTTAWPGTLNITVEQDHPVQYIALRNKAGIDTLDADSTSLEQASNVDVGAFDAYVRGFCEMVSPLAEPPTGRISHDDHIIDCAILIQDLTRHVDVVSDFRTVSTRTSRC